MFGSYSYTNTNNIRVQNTSEIESLDFCKNTRACLDPKKKYGQITFTLTYLSAEQE